MRVRKTLLQILVFVFIGTGSSPALPPAGENPTCAVKGATIQAATVTFEVAGLRKGAVTFWNSDSPHFQIPTPHDGSPAHLNLNRFEPNQMISLDLWAHGQSSRLCTITFIIQGRVIAGALPSVDPYKSGQGIDLSNKDSAEVERLSRARQTKIRLLVDDIDDKLRRMREIGPSDPVLDQELTNLQNKLAGITVDIARVSGEHDDLFSTKLAPNESEIASRGAVLAEAEDALIQSARALLADTTRSYLLHESQIPPIAYEPAPGGYFLAPLPPKLVGRWQIKIFYATDRKPSGNTVRPFTSERDPQATHYGSAVVSFPSAHTKGLIEEPKWWRFQFSVDASKHVVSYTPFPLDKRAYLSGIKTQMNISSKRVLIFVHGYNCTFEDTVLRTAQIAKDLHFNGVPIAYDWTSAGNPMLYGTDEQAIQSSLNRLKNFLVDASRSTGASSITVIAHSMGNQILLSALTELSAQNLMFPIDNLILAAPDVDTLSFNQQIAQLIESNKVKRFTLYASSWDFAVALAAHVVNHAPVAGQAASHLFILRGIDTIDASSLPREDFFGHSYFADTIPALQDLAELINFGWGPQMRSYLRPEALPSSHWALEASPH